MKITVLHARSFLAPQLVASVDGGDRDELQSLDHAWRYTNNVDGSWSKKIGEDASDSVEVLVDMSAQEYGLRSSSVGDFFYCHDSDQMYKVAMIGFEQIDDREADLVREIIGQHSATS